VLNGLDIPLILAATEPIDSIFRLSCSYPHLAAVGIPGSPVATSDLDLAARARIVLNELNADELGRLRALYDDRRSYGRTAEDVADVARAATLGAVEAVFVDIDEVIPGSIDERTGAVTFGPPADPVSYGVVDEIARRVWLNGGRVLAVRRDDIPGGNSVAAILRYAVDLGSGPLASGPLALRRAGHERLAVGAATRSGSIGTVAATAPAADPADGR
jgi:hypothetical protein